METARIDPVLARTELQNRQYGSSAACFGAALLLAGLTVGCIKRHWSAAIPAFLGSCLTLKGCWSYHRWDKAAHQKMHSMVRRTDEQWTSDMSNAAWRTSWDECHALARQRWPDPSVRLREELLWTQGVMNLRAPVGKAHLDHLLKEHQGAAGRRALLGLIAANAPLSNAQADRSVGLQLWEAMCQQALATAPEQEEAALGALADDAALWPSESPVIMDILQHCLDKHLRGVRATTMQLADKMAALLPTNFGGARTLRGTR